MNRCDCDICNGRDQINDSEEEYGGCKHQWRHIGGNKYGEYYRCMKCGEETEG